MASNPPKKPTTTPRSSNSDNGRAHTPQASAPYENVVSAVVGKIQDQPFLFVIGIAALLIGLVVLAAGLGSSDLRFLVIVIAGLAFLAILGFYIVEVLRTRSDARRPGQPRVPSDEAARKEAGKPGQEITGFVQADSLSEDAQARGVRVVGDVPQANIHGEALVKKGSGHSQAMGVDIGESSADKADTTHTS